MKFKKVLSSLLAATMLFGSVYANAVTVETDDMPKASGAAVEVESSGFDEVQETVDKTVYGLPENIQDGAILHAFCWSFKTIYAAIPEIAAAGYTAIQTSPVSKCYSKHPAKVLMGDLTNESSGEDGAWWWQYQPTEFVVGNYQLVEDPTDQLACEAEYRAMCNRAHKYGIKIITDIVANHTTAEFKTEQGHTNEYAVTDDFKNAIVGQDGDFFDIYHDHYNDPRPGENYNRNQRINYMNGGLPDIDTENETYQAYVVTFLNKLIELGCDGFRFDTALNIGIDGDGAIVGDNKDYNFWKAVTGEIEVNGVQLNKRGKDIFFYGEILKNDNTNLNRLYTYSKYLSVTNYEYGYKLRDHVKGNTLKNADSLSGWGHILSSDKQITWVESHDNYCNRKNNSINHESSMLTSFQIRAGWAIITARAEGTPLFFNRPAGSEPSANDPEKIWGVGKENGNTIGVRGNDEWRHREVKAVNQFRNAMVGQGEKLSNINNNSKILQIDRGDCGCCIVNLSSSEVSLNDKSTCLADGFYVDRAAETPALVEVRNGKFVDYTVYPTSIAVIMSPINMNAITDTPYFFTDTCDLQLTINENIGGTNITSGNYVVKVDGATTASSSFSNNSILTIGSGIVLNDSVTSKDITVILSATDPNFGSNTFTRTFKFAKRNNKDVTYLYCTPNSQSWNPFCAYMYLDLDDGTTLKNASWPGNELGTDPSTGYRFVEIPYPLKNAKFIVTNELQAKDPSSGGYSLSGKSKLYKGSNTVEDYVVESEEPEEPVTKNGQYVYFYNTYGWAADKIYAYMWKDSNNVTTDMNASFPGKKMSWSEDLQCYYYKYDSTKEFNHVIFNVYYGNRNSNNKQTADLTMNDQGKIFVPTGVDGNSQYTGSWNAHSDMVYQKIYYKNSSVSGNVYVQIYNNTDSSKKISADPGIQMTRCGDNSDYYCCIFAQPGSIYDRVTFKTGTASSTTNQVSGAALPAADSENNIYDSGWTGLATPTDNIEIDVNFKYTDRSVQNVGSGEKAEFEEVLCKKTFTKGLKSYNLNSFVTAASNDLKASNSYITFKFRTSQNSYINEIVSSGISGEEDPLKYSLKINPAYYAYHNDAYGDGYEPYVASLTDAKDSNEKWVTYYSDENCTNEVLPSAVAPDLSNVAAVDVWGFCTTTYYDVHFSYPKKSADVDSLISFGGDQSLYVGVDYTGDKHVSRSYNKLVCSKDEEFITNMYTPSGKEFDGWYIINFTKDGQGNDVVDSYMKVSSDEKFNYRVTSGAAYCAVFRSADNNQGSAGVLAIADTPDKFTDSSNVDWYRFNTIMNPYNCWEKDSRIESVGVFYLKTSGLNGTQIGDLKDDVKAMLGDSGTSESGNISVNSSDVGYLMYRYGVSASGAENSVVLTEKNRLMFTLQLKSTVAETGSFSNATVFTAFKMKNGEWILSDNYVTYNGGVPTQSYISN